MTATECAGKSSSGASADGNCASGFGVCCVFTVKCGSNANTVANNCTYIQESYTPQIVYRVAICPGGNLPYIQITTIVLPFIRLPYKRSLVYLTKHPLPDKLLLR